jgi:hypothetical protein
LPHLCETVIQREHPETGCPFSRSPRSGETFFGYASQGHRHLETRILRPSFQSLRPRYIRHSQLEGKNSDSAKTETQKTSATEFVKDILTKGMTKSFFGFTYFQELFAEYVDIAGASDIRSMASSVVDHSIHLLSTRAGARVVAACASYGSPKDRKRICKSLKGYTRSSLLHRDAYLALLRLIEVTDDTVSINKSVFTEILTLPKDEAKEENVSALLDLATSETASKLFLMLLVEDDATRMKYFDPYERSILEH